MARRPAARAPAAPGRDIDDARDVADRLGIPHYVIDAEEAFRRAVIEDFADSYAAGETPVPCVRCNQSVKFTDLLGLARDLGAEAMATGHYVRRVEGAAGPELHRARDPQRDQSWFLFATTREQLAFTRFPLGDMPDKAAVRAEAARLGLPVAEKPDSQDICFVPSGSLRRPGGRLRPDAARPGDIVDRTGRAGPASRGGALHGRSAQGSRRARRRSPCSRWTRRGSASWSGRARPGGGSFGCATSTGWRTRPTTFECEVKLRAREAPHAATVYRTAAAPRWNWPNRHWPRRARPASCTAAARCLAAGSSSGPGGLID